MSEAELIPASVCKHHWLIEMPQGATSVGRCKRCGESKEFANSLAAMGLPDYGRAYASETGGESGKPLIETGD